MTEFYVNGANESIIPVLLADINPDGEPGDVDVSYTITLLDISYISIL